MKLFQSRKLATLVLTIALASCNNNTPDNSAVVKSDTTNVTSASTTDLNLQKTDANKKLVTDFIQSFYGDKDSTAIDKYVADNVIEHNPLLQDGKEWLKNALRPFLSNPNIPKAKIDIKHIAAEGDMVWVHIRDVAPNGKEFNRVDIFRIENGKIAEKWKVSEAVVEKSVNKHSEF